MSIADQSSVQTITTSFLRALSNGQNQSTPYRHWLLRDLFPHDVLQELGALAFPLTDLAGVSGKRELHNEQRHYFDQKNITRHKVMGELAHAFQSSSMIDGIEAFFDIDLRGTFLRLEFAQDTDGFWLAPHTDLGVKKLTVLIYLSDDENHDSLGTDIFNADKSWSTRTPFAPNHALAFVPADNTYHGFVERPIKGIRRSVILNYVTDDWRDRDQLAFPQQPIESRD